MKNGKEMAVKDQFAKPRKHKTREVSSRFMSSPSSTPTHDSRVSTPTISSPARQKPAATFETKRHQKAHEDKSKSSILWPSATGISYSSRQSSQKSDTLADHLGIGSLKDMLDHEKNIVGSSALFLHRQSSWRENRSFETDHCGAGKKENLRPVLGGSMRYTKKLVFNGKNLPSAISGRFSFDEKVSKSDLFQDTESECSDMSSSSSKKSGVDVPSRYMNSLTSRRSMPDSNPESSPKLQKFTIKGAIKRASGASSSQWALSPGRTGSSPVSNKSRAFSFSAMKPPTSPSKQNGVEKLLNLGFDLFKIKKSSPSSTSHDSGESIHQLRLLHNRLIQWRTVNARASIANQNTEEEAERNLICAWESLTKLRHSVVQKKLQLEKQRLEMKLNFLLRSQLKPLEAWKEMEGQHSSAVSRTAECLNSVVCRLPLKDGAVAELESTWYALRHTSDLTSAVKLNLNALTHSVEESVPMLVELAKVVSQEKLLMEECLEHIRIISDLEVQEWSLMSSMLQLNTSKQQERQQ